MRNRRRYSDESQMPHARYAAFTRDASHIHQSAGAVTDNVGHFGDAGGRGFDTPNVRTFFLFLSDQRDPQCLALTTPNK